MTLNKAITHFFVYGTLKRGECREKCWPHKALQIEPAWIIGELYDTGEYPALIRGNEPVLGEVWSFSADDFPAVVQALDEIEDYCLGRTENLYTRERIECTTLDGRKLSAYTYYYAQLDSLRTFQRLSPSVHLNGMQFARWARLTD